MTRDYEALVILNSTGTDAELQQAVARTEDVVKKLGGVIEKSQSFGRRRLAYRIGRQQEGCYHLVSFRLPPAQLEELKRTLRLNETIVRFLVLNREDSQIPVPAALN